MKDCMEDLINIFKCPNCFVACATMKGTSIKNIKCVECNHVFKVKGRLVLIK